MSSQSRNVFTTNHTDIHTNFNVELVHRNEPDCAHFPETPLKILTGAHKDRHPRTHRHTEEALNSDFSNNSGKNTAHSHPVTDRRVRSLWNSAYLCCINLAAAVAFLHIITVQLLTPVCLGLFESHSGLFCDSGLQKWNQAWSWDTDRESENQFLKLRITFKASIITSAQNLTQTTQPACLSVCNYVSVSASCFGCLIKLNITTTGLMQNTHEELHKHSFSTSSLWILKPADRSEKHVL